jgi:hypothetical protein
VAILSFWIRDGVGNFVELFFREHEQAGNMSVAAGMLGPDLFFEKAFWYLIRHNFNYSPWSSLSPTLGLTLMSDLMPPGRSMSIFVVPGLVMMATLRGRARRVCGVQSDRICRLPSSDFLCH